MLKVTQVKILAFEVYRLKGTFDAQYASHFRSEILAQVAAGKKQFIFNLAEVDFVDSTGLGVLVSILKRILENEGELYLVQPSERILEVFMMTKLDQVFAILNSEEEALGVK